MNPLIKLLQRNRSLYDREVLRKAISKLPKVKVSLLDRYRFKNNPDDRKRGTFFRLELPWKDIWIFINTTKLWHQDETKPQISDYVVICDELGFLIVVQLEHQACLSAFTEIFEQCLVDEDLKNQKKLGHFVSQLNRSNACYFRPKNRGTKNCMNPSEILDLCNKFGLESPLERDGIQTGIEIENEDDTENSEQLEKKEEGEDEDEDDEEEEESNEFLNAVDGDVDDLVNRLVRENKNGKHRKNLEGPIFKLHPKKLSRRPNLDTDFIKKNLVRMLRKNLIDFGECFKLQD